VTSGECRTHSSLVTRHSSLVIRHSSLVLHAPLALTAARWLRAQAVRPIRLESCGDPAATIAIYEALGFTITDHEVSYVRDLADGP